MLGGSRQVIAESQKLEVLTSEISQGMNEMFLGTAEINTAVNEINTASVKNQESIQILTGELGKFKV
jgi:methyl-accepting chemotaxis protein